MRVGAKIDDRGVLLREGEAVYFRRDAGGRYKLDLRRVIIDDASVNVRVRGVYVGTKLIDVDEIMPV